VPSGGGAAPFFFDMFNIVTGSLLALDSKFGGAGCLSHVGTEGGCPLSVPNPRIGRPRCEP
jgi:hypothetical protein